jgi:hypothetical protein
LSDPQLEKLVLMVSRGNESVNAVEFLHRFVAAKKVTDNALDLKHVEDQWAELAVRSLARFLYMIGGPDALHSVFTQVDVNGDGFLSEDEIAQGVMNLPGIENLLIEGTPIREDDVRRMFRHIDDSQDGKTSYLEFVSACTLTNESGSLDSIVVEHVTSTLFRFRATLLTACGHFDTELCGRIAHDEFLMCLEALVKVLEGVGSIPPFTPEQVSAIVEGTCVEGMLQYVNFFENFQVVDVTLMNVDGTASTVVDSSTLNARRKSSFRAKQMSFSAPGKDP